MKPIFIRLTPVNTAFGYFINATQVEMMFQNEKDGATTILFVASPAIKVKETPKEVMELVRQAASLETGPLSSSYNFDD